MADSPSARRSNTTDSTDGEMMSALAAELLDDSNILGLREYLELFEEIAEPTRFAICYTLQTKGTMSASELGDTLNRTENGLHYHLDRLQDAGLVENRKRSKPNADGLTARWSAMIHAQHSHYDTFEDEVHQIGAFLQEQQTAD